MIQLDLNGIWEMNGSKEAGSLAAKVPGSVISTLSEHRRIPDPYWQDNERKLNQAADSVFYNDYSFSRSFIIDQTCLQHDQLLLHCEGLDTLAEIYLNHKQIAAANNMHRMYQFDIKDRLQEGENQITILFRSPVRYLEDYPSKTGKPYSVLRKAACMFGWDWGIRLPDSGIWRNIYIESFDYGRLEHVQITQIHENNRVTLQIMPYTKIWDDSIWLRISVTDPHGKILALYQSPDIGESFNFSIPEPELWWPVGYGEQPLYTITVEMMREHRVLDQAVRRIGLRTLTHSRADQESGSEYAFSVNGIPIYFRGENMIIDDAIISRTTEQSWRKLVETAVKSNLNGIRIWGGAYYPPDCFYELCDEAGLMLYQDFMFACSFYPADEEFLENVRIEAEQNIKRICHHPSIAIYCGNNEIDAHYTVANSSEAETVALRKQFNSGEEVLPLSVRQKLWDMYREIFLDILPGVCSTWAPDTAYVHSSPSVKIPGGGTSFNDYLSDGDMHYYLQYNNNAPYQKMRTKRCRFMTEIGFQSYPSLKTIKAFSATEDQTPDSPIMYAHQKCKNGNEAIEEYMARDYRIPGDFEDYIYLSQLQAGEIMRYTAEHFRRDSGYNRGMILWQLNDCWPVVSWSGVDYYGRWKALQYFIKRFFAPVAVSARDDGMQVALWAGNETRKVINATLHWQLYDGDKILISADIQTVLSPGQSSCIADLDFTEIVNESKKNQIYLAFQLEADHQTVSRDTILFVLARDFAFSRPGIQWGITEEKDCYLIKIKTEHYARRIALDTVKGDCVFSDNWFDLPAGSVRSVMLRKEDTDIPTLDMLKETLYIKTLNEIMMQA